MVFLGLDSASAACVGDAAEKMVVKN